MAISASMHEERAVVANWPAAACMLRSTARKVILEANDLPFVNRKGASLQGQAKSRVPIRPAVVGLLPSNMEWEEYDHRDTPHKSCRGANIRRVRVMGLRGLHILRRVVPGEIPRLLEHGPYHCEGTSPSDNRCSTVGSSMAGQYCSGTLRQCSGGSYCEVWPEQE